MFKRSSSQQEVEWSVKHDKNTLLRAEGIWSLIGAPSKGWNVVLWKEGYEVQDSSLLVRVDRGEVKLPLPDSFCKIGGGYRTNTRQVLRSAVLEGACEGEL